MTRGDTFADIPLAVAVALAGRYGLTEVDARECLVAALERRRLSWRIDPAFPADDSGVRCRIGADGPLDYRPRLELRRGVDWAASEATVLERYPRDFSQTPCAQETPRRVRVLVDPDQWLAIVKREVEFAGPSEAPEPAAAPPVPLTAAVESARGRVSESALRRWCDDYIREHNAAGTVPSREQMEKDARAAFEGKSIDRTLLRKLRPQEWRKSGRRNPGKKLLAAELPK